LNGVVHVVDLSKNMIRARSLLCRGVVFVRLLICWSCFIVRSHWLIWTLIKSPTTASSLTCSPLNNDINNRWLNTNRITKN